ncbi:MAG: hypothetical protein LBV69_03345 [Bacteroidales bacterium]|jgi:hypothetical protein|nr:hypothetical protein [Bacteroidales bacterium]
MKHLKLFIILFLSVIIFYQCANSKNKNRENKSFINDSISETEILKKSEYQKIAEFISGIEFFDKLDTSIINQKFWEKYQLKIENDWEEIDTSRIKLMKDWQKSEIQPKINDTLNLLYPFSGPDFLNANILFPNANNYIMLAMEPLGSIPDFSTMNENQIQEYLDVFYFSIHDIFIRSFFQTKEMKKDLSEKAIHGVLPLILYFMVKTNNEILDISYEKLNSTNNFDTITVSDVTEKFSSGECLLIKFKKYDKIKTLRYFSCDISDSGLEANQNLKKYLESFKNYNSYTKSASYLLHYPHFSFTRNLLIENSQSILQDDTGIPYKYFSKNNWETNLYGVYEKPLSLFGDFVVQKDLSEIYKTDKNISKLPFSLGYHWRTGKQNEMLFVKKVQ